MSDVFHLSELRPANSRFNGTSGSAARLRPGLRSPFSPAEELELAARLLGLTSGAELERFFRDLVAKAGRSAGSISSNLIGPVAKLLRAVATKAVPSAAAAAGTFLEGPPSGAIAAKLGSMVGQALEAEAAGLAVADRDLEKCLQFIRMAGAAARAAASAPARVHPLVVAHKTLADAANAKLAGRTSSVGRSGSTYSGGTLGVSTDLANVGDRPARHTSRTDPQIHRSLTCSICERPSNICQCGKIRDSGHWLRRGSSIIVSC